MNPRIESIIQAEIDGLATEEDIRVLDEAAANDPEILSMRSQFRRIADGVSRIQTFDPPPDLTDRVMRALPAPRPEVAVSPGSVVERVAEVLRSLARPSRRQIVFALALGVVITIGLSVTLQPPTDSVERVTGTLMDDPASSPGAILHSVPMSGGVGRVDVRELAYGFQVEVALETAGDLLLELQFGAPDAQVEEYEPANPDAQLVRRPDGVVEFHAPGTDRVVLRTGPIPSLHLTVFSDGAIVLASEFSLVD